MNAEQRESLKNLSEIHRQIHQDRCRAESHGFFTVLTFFALLAAAKFTGKVTIPSGDLFYWGAWIVIAVVAAVSSLYLYGLHKANSVNKGIAQSAEDAPIAMLTEENIEIGKPKHAGKPVANTCLWQIVMITVFAAACGVCLTVF